MTREDYEKFIDVFDSELSDRYILSVPRKGYDTYQRFIQIYRKNTVLDEGNNPLGGGHPPYIYIDIFPFDYVPNNKLLRQYEVTSQFANRGFTLHTGNIN
jgi:lipopolysaccharide cholinephosphotransferase